MLSHSQEYAIVGERSFFFKISPLSQRRATSPPVSKYQVQVVINNWVTRINRESYFLVNPISYIGLVKIMYWVTVNVLYCWFSLSTLRARLKPRGWWDLLSDTKRTADFRTKPRERSYFQLLVSSLHHLMYHSVQEGMHRAPFYTGWPQTKRQILLQSGDNSTLWYKSVKKKKKI